MSKPSKKQLEARRKFTYVMKHGGFKKSKKQGSKQTRRKSQKLLLKSRKTLKKALDQSRRLSKNKSLSQNYRDSEHILAEKIEKALRDNTVKSITITK